MQYLRADTITEVTVGPAVAVGDAFTPVTSLAIAGADEAELIKHGATTTTAITGTLAAITGADGYYALDLSATDTNTEGRLTLLINDDSLILPIRLEFMVVSQPVFDSLFAADGTDRLPVDAVEWLGGTIATPTQTGVPEVDVTFVSGVAEDLPSNTELNARTLVAASYFDPAADTVDVGSWLGTAVATPTVAGVPEVEVTHWDGQTVSVDATLQPNVNVSSIRSSFDAAIFLSQWIESGAGGLADSGSTTTMVDAVRTEADDVFNGSWIIFRTGAVAGQTRLITDFDAATDTVTFAPPTTAAVAATDGYVIIPAGATDNVVLGTPVGADISTDIQDLPTVAEFNARTLVAASYYDPAADTVDVGVIQASAAQTIRDEIMPTQNVAFSNLEFLFVSSGDHVTPVTGATGISGTRSIDGGAFVAVSGAIAEVANGIYQFDALAADMNGGVITFRFIATGGTPAAPDDVFVTIVTGGGV